VDTGLAHPLDNCSHTRHSAYNGDAGSRGGKMDGEDRQEVGPAMADETPDAHAAGNADETGDYAHTDVASANRTARARVLAAFCWDRALSSYDVRALPGTLKRSMAAEADVRPPSTDETWELVCALLDRMRSWAAAHPDHPRAQVAYPRGRARWVRGVRP